MPLDQLYAEHRTIVGVVNRLVRMVNPEAPQPIEAIGIVRRELSQLFDEHLAHEGAIIDHDLATSSEHLHQCIVKRYREGLLDLQLGLTMHMGKWTQAMLSSDMADYRDSLRRQFAPCIERIAWEERVVFPLIEEARNKRGDFSFWLGAKV